MWSCLGDAEIAPLTGGVIVCLCRIQEAEASTSVTAVTQTPKPGPSGTPVALAPQLGVVGVSRSQASQEGLTDKECRKRVPGPLSPSQLTAEPSQTPAPKAVRIQEVLGQWTKDRRGAAARSPGGTGGPVGRCFEGMIPPEGRPLGAEPHGRCRPSHPRTPEILQSSRPSGSFGASGGVAPRSPLSSGDHALPSETERASRERPAESSS